MGKVTQNDIAKKVGVSRTTVARALNNSGYIEEETKNLILKTAKKMGYKVNPIARTIASNKNILVHVFLIDSYNIFFDKMIEDGIKAAEEEFSYFGAEFVIHHHVATDAEKQLEEFKKTVSKENMQGVIIAPLLIENLKSSLKIAHNRNINIVTMNMDIDKSERFAYVGPNYHKGGALAAEILANYVGLEGDIVMLRSKYHFQSVDERSDGFVEKINQYKKIRLIRIYYHQNLEDAYELTKTAVKEFPNLKGIYTSTEIGYVSKALRDIGRLDIKKVGNDLNDNIVNEIKKGEIQASIHQRPFLQGYLSGRYLLEKIIYDVKPVKEKVYVGYDVACQENLEFDNMFLTYR